MSSLEYYSQNHQSTSSMACHLSSWNATAQSNSFWQRASILNGRTFLTGCVLCSSQAVCFVPHRLCALFIAALIRLF